MGSRSETSRRSILLVSVSDGALPRLLEEQGVGLERAAELDGALAALGSRLFDAVFIEQAEVAEQARIVSAISDAYPDVPLVVCGAEGSEALRAALAAGAVDYLPLPTSVEAIRLSLEAAASRQQIAVTRRAPLGATILGSSPLIAQAREKIARIAMGSTTVLLRGETGTGKELAARAVHARGERRDAPFVTVHAAALPDALLESELFGYEKGAFTGATTRKPGRVELAEGGTLFLDEIGDLSFSVQVKLLRLIQEREYECLGGTRTQRADVRIIAATHRDLEDMVAKGQFREDLLYRLNVVTLWLPPLRARREDIAIILDHYLDVFRKKNDKRALALEAAALRLLQAERWPGNVRQLVNLIERLVLLASGPIVTAEDVRLYLNEHLVFVTQASSVEIDAALSQRAPASGAVGGPERDAPRLDTSGARGANLISSVVRPLREDLRNAEQRALTKALRHAKGNRALAARLLGISRRTLYTKLEEHGIE